MSHSHDNTLPRGALVIAASLVIFALAATTAVRVTGTPPSASPELLRASTAVAPIASRDLRFRDRPDGSVLIEDAGSGNVASIVAANSESGFVRSVMRGLARERRMHGIGAEPPFRLTQWADGQLSLTDSATGRSIELNAFGDTNRAEFAALLPPVKVAAR